MKLSPQETRNAVYGGDLNALCLRLSENMHFRQMWGIPQNVEDSGLNDDIDESSDDAEMRTSTPAGIRLFQKMEDVELVLRFFAYRHIQKSKAGLNKISAFLDSFLRDGNKFPASVLASYEVEFVETIEFLFECLGVNAFSVLTDRRPRPTKIVFDPIMYVANAPDVQQARPKILADKSVLYEELTKMYTADHESGQLSFAGRRTNSSDIQSRNKAMRAAFDSTLARI